MLQNESVVTIIDNSGAKRGKIFRLLKGSAPKRVSIGDKVKIAIKDAAPGSSVKKGEVATAVIVRTRKEIGRPDGSYVRFGDNAAVLITVNDKGETAPVGKRVFGPVARELRDLGYRFITNMAEEVI